MKYLNLVCSCLLLASCASTPHYGFIPVTSEQETISATERGASFPVHIGESDGTMHVMSFGLVDLSSKTKPVAKKALHLCVIVKQTKGTGSWSLNVRDQKVALEGTAPLSAAYVNSNLKEAPVITIPPGQTRHVDLFYPLPADIEKAKEIRGFDFQWKIMSGKTAFNETTPFSRVKRKSLHPPVVVNEPLQHQEQTYDMEEMSPQVWWIDPLYPMVP